MIMTDKNMHHYEQKYADYQHIAGIDEVGRGPLAGPVVSCAVILPKSFDVPVRDSKKLTEKKRNALYEQIMEQAVAVSLGIVDNEKIDEINILEATKLSMLQAINGLSVTPDFLLIDALRLPVGIPQAAIIGGDDASASIAAASIVAKVTRDQLMLTYDMAYPHYGFAKHKGYGTKQHREALWEHGVCPIHRMSFLTKILG